MTFTQLLTLLKANAESAECCLADPNVAYDKGYLHDARQAAFDAASAMRVFDRENPDKLDVLKAMLEHVESELIDLGISHSSVRVAIQEITWFKTGY
ncbi:hypothetical protein [Bowmanella sp. JS7-9]|uniref:Uncharacterized protein n=1 Tax=Pseudobowmanella zhangzhouensis TaxID=1537679 RepID=A0ABW1XMM8_9ALTE|nr:hypothetical protein [Bowmanella sp. JS7-9]TBX21908.1 hypothetical protein TK45_10470 [Bowmanella sp. JS7-9]